MDQGHCPRTIELAAARKLLTDIPPLGEIVSTFKGYFVPRLRSIL